MKEDTTMTSYAHSRYKNFDMKICVRQNMYQTAHGLHGIYWTLTKINMTYIRQQQINKNLQMTSAMCYTHCCLSTSSYSAEYWVHGTPNRYIYNCNWVTNHTTQNLTLFQEYTKLSSASQFNYYANLGVLKKVNRSEWVAPTFIQPKNKGLVRFCLILGKYISKYVGNPSQFPN